MKKNNNFGIVYVATGINYVNEAIQSALSAKKVMHDIPISLWTDTEAEFAEPIFDVVNVMSNPTYSFFDKIKPLIETSYEKTLFVDTDTFFTDSVYELSILLDNFELAYAHAPMRVCRGINNTLEDVPICFPEANTGVIAYRNTERVINLISEWARIYSIQLEGENPPRHDQPAFRKALYYSDVRSTVLTPEYNIRTVFPVFKGGGCPAKILHGREPSLSKAIATINNNDGVAIYDFNKSS